MPMIVPTLATLLFLGLPAAAQETTRLLPDGSAVGGAVGAFIIEDEPIYTIGLNVLGLRAERVYFAGGEAYALPSVSVGLAVLTGRR